MGDGLSIAPLESDEAAAARKSYLDDVLSYIGRLASEGEKRREEFISPEKLAANREGYRGLFRKMLGRPLTDKLRSPVPNIEEHTIANDDMGEVRRIRLEITEGVHGCGLLFLPPEYGRGAKLPLIISQHGGAGTPELCSAERAKSSNYNGMTRRALALPAVVYAPFSLTGDAENGLQRLSYSRANLDAALHQFGADMTALEVLHVSRAIDRFSALDGADAERVGMIGLSWGGYYTVMCAAADSRIKCAYASCQFNSRTKYNVPDWVFANAGNTFLDAELAALIAPRRLAIECGRRDNLFTPDTAEAEYERLRPFYEAQGAADELRFSIHDGFHELDKDDRLFGWCFSKIK